MKETLRIVVIGTVIWAMVFVIEIARSAPNSTLWICATGTALGLLGILDLFRRMRKQR